MTVHYGKNRGNLEILGRKILPETKYLYECIWTVNEKDVMQILSMLIDCITLGVDSWRINQIRQSYQITEEILLTAAEDYKITVLKTGENGYKLHGVSPKTKQVIRIETDNLLRGIVQMLVRAEIDISSRHKDSKD